jgi:hypothetical protein
MTDDHKQIIDYFDNQITIGQLSKQQAEILNRVDVCDNLLRDGKSDSQIVSTLRKKFPDVSQRTAYYDIHVAKSVYKSRSVLDKDFEKNRLLDMNLGALDWAKQENNLKEYNIALLARMKILGLDKEQKEIVDPTLYQQHNYQMIFNLKSGPKQVSIKDIQKLDIKERNKLLDNMMDSLIEKDVLSILKIDGSDKAEDE